MEKNHRLFLRNLPIDIDENNLKKFFGEYGKVTNIDIKDKIQHDGSKIAFINITTTDLQLNTCFRAANEKTFGGCAIDVQVAKESYLERLKREREEVLQSRNLESKASSGHADATDDFPIQKINIKVPAGVKSKPTKKKYNFDNDDDGPGAGQDCDDRSTLLPDFSWDPALKVPTIAIRGESTRVESTHGSEVCEPLKKAEKKVVGQSEIKRLASVKEKRQTFKLHEKLISQALKAVDSNHRNNRLIFSQDVEPIVGYGEKSTGIGARGGGVSLFDDDDDNSEDQQDRNDDKFKYDETRNAKLKISLSNPTGDKRFVIDERFLDHEGGANDDQMKKEVTAESDAANADDETKWQLDILGNVLGKPFRARNEKTGGGGGGGDKKQNKMIRYDPTSICHKNHELVMEKPIPRAKRIKLAKGTSAVEQDNTQTTTVTVSSDIFYEVSKNLTQTLNDQEEFSLLKSFGTVPPPTNDKTYDTNGYGSQGEKLMKNGIDDAFKYESSSDEDASPSIDQITCNKTKDEQVDSFFFAIDDQRFCEAEQFFNTRPSTGTDYDFTNVRRQLKQIVRSKIRNNVRKNTPWGKTKVPKQPKIR